MHCFSTYARFLYRWHGLHDVKSGNQARRAALDKLQGYVLPYSDLETQVLPARIVDYQFGELDRWCEDGSMAWQGHERLSAHDGSVSIYTPDNMPRLARIPGLLPGSRYTPLRDLLAEQDRGFDILKSALGGFPPQVLAGLWDLVWAGEVSNRRLLPLLAILARQGGRTRSRRYPVTRRLRGLRPLESLPGSVGIWYLITGPRSGAAPPMERDHALVAQLLKRWGIIGQPCLKAEGVIGGLAGLTAILDEMRKDGAVVQGVFVEGCGSSQFSTAETLDGLNEAESESTVWTIAATDPANPYGKLAPWPSLPKSGLKPRRVAGARVILFDGALIGYLSTSGRDLTTFDVFHGREAGAMHHALVQALAGAARPGQPILLRKVDGRSPGCSHLAPFLRSAGFLGSRNGYIFRA
jgi:ATP-dependent Lhr-like helicase